MDKTIEIIESDEKWAESLAKMRDSVAREREFVFSVEGPTVENAREGIRYCREKGYIDLLAIDGDQVVGSIEISHYAGMASHRANLGMAVLKSHRGKGLGKRLMEEALKRARQKGTIEKIELSVYTDNHSAIALYKKMGFTECGFNRHQRKFEGRYKDALLMELFLI